MGKFLIVVVLFAAAVYALLWLRERRRAARSGWTPPKRGSGPQTRQVAPDDDEDFLRWLNRKQRSGQEPRQPGGPSKGRSDEPPGDQSPPEDSGEVDRDRDSTSE